MYQSITPDTIGAGYRRQSLTLAITLISLGIAPHALGQENQEPERTFLLDQVTITGGAQRIEQTPGSAQILSREDMDRIGSSDPSKVLRAVPGVNIAEEDGLGQFPSISMRGVRPERSGRINLMEDGILVGSPAPYSAPAAYYIPPIARMDSIEVLKGPSAIRHGPNTVGGAINFISTPIPQEPSGSIHYQRGGRNSEQTHATIGGTEGQWGFLLESFANSTDGFKELDFPTSGRQSDKPNNPKPETGLNRRNTVAKLRWNSDPAATLYQEVELKVADDNRRVNETYLGILPEDFKDNPNRRYAGSQFDEFNGSNRLYQISHYLELSDTTSVSTSFYRTETTRNWYKLGSVNNGDGTNFVGIADILQNPNDNADAMAWILGNDVRFGADRFTINADSRGRVRANNREYKVEGVQVKLDHRYNALGWSNEVQVGARYHEDEEDRLQWDDTYAMENGNMVLTEEQRPGDQTNRLTEAEALALHIQNTATRGPWTLQAGLRREDIKEVRRDWQDGSSRDNANLSNGRPRENRTTVWIPGVGAVYRFTDQWSALVGYNRGFSPPGNDPDSKAERSDNFEAGFRFRDSFTQAEVIAFYNDYSNINIECTNVGAGCNAQDIGNTQSVGAVDIYGLEALVLHDLGQSQGLSFGLPLSAAYTFTDSEFGQDIGGDAPNQWENARKGDRLPEIPEHQLNLGVGVVQDLWRVNLNANFTSGTQAFADPAKRDLKIDSRWVLDLAARYQILENVQLTGRVENLLDDVHVAHHRPAGLRPGAPRTAWAGIKVDF
ncbi:MAG: TonB-dependent receptor [Halomonadaceae bacterium]|nr:MAG: TonB-dependent receptor [Halomonadaceae bacterium]